jgi:hypothetical protein
MDPPTAAGRPDARPQPIDNEEHWRELSAELDAADEELRRLLPAEGELITPELFDQLEAAKRRRYKVQFAMIDFLDTLDDMPP